tara:strand:- start:101616 stop:101837 length:222 start_codon:yes stop_codon:yes gene_type:complete
MPGNSDVARFFYGFDKNAGKLKRLGFSVPHALLSPQRILVEEDLRLVLQTINKKSLSKEAKCKRGAARIRTGE